MEFTHTEYETLVKTSEKVDSQERRLEAVEADIKILKEKNEVLYEMSVNLKTLSDGVIAIKEDVKTMKTEQGQFREELADLRNAPHKKKSQWMDKAIGAVIGAIGAGVLAFLLNTLCPSIFS